MKKYLLYPLCKTFSKGFQKIFKRVELLGIGIGLGQSFTLQKTRRLFICLIESIKIPTSIIKCFLLCYI